MSDRIPTGAYVIRNKHARTVLHLVMPQPDGRESISDVVALDQDENKYHDQQIWWIEPLPQEEEPEGSSGSQGSLFYSITNPCSVKALHMTGVPGRIFG